MTAMKGSTILLLAWSLIIDLNVAQIPNITFSCRNGEYIESNQYCDGFQQCSDGSDEPPVCNNTRRNCELGKFHCPSNGLCIDADLLSDMHVQKYCPQSSKKERMNVIDVISEIEAIFSKMSSFPDPKFICDDVRCLSVYYVCGGYCDCFNCSGDSKSYPEVGNVLKSEVVNCSSQNDKFLCNDNKRCLSLEYVCDGYCNCFDCSDENGECSVVDYTVLGTCPDYYFPTPSGARCLPDLKINQLSDCGEKHVCDQKCTQFKTRAICSCDDGYIKISTNGVFRCEKESSQNSLLYSTPRKIKVLNLTTAEAVVIKNQVECKMLTAAHNYIYYIDNMNRIFKHSLSLKDTTEIKLDNLQDEPITSIAVDYITDNLYFTTNTTLSVCDFNHQICKELLNHNVNYVVLAPTYGWMFYTVTSFNLEEMYIMKSNMDGSNETILIDGSFRSITALTIDETVHRLYGYSSTDNEFFSMSFYGDNSEYQSFFYHGIIVSITALDSRIFYTTYQNRRIHITEKNEYFTKRIDENVKISKYPLISKLLLLNNDNIPLIEGENTLAIKYLHAYDTTQQRNQKVRNPCVGLNICSGLCLLRSKNSVKDLKLRFTCFCHGISLTTYPFWCRDNSPLNVTTRSSQSPAERDAMIRSSTQSRSVARTNMTRNMHISLINYKGATTSQSFFPTDIVPHQTVLETIGCTVALFIAVLCIGYILHNKWKQYYHNSVMRNAAQRHFNDQERFYIGQEEL